jgi:hypothetical protein
MSHHLSLSTVQFLDDAGGRPGRTRSRSGSRRLPAHERNSRGWLELLKRIFQRIVLFLTSNAFAVGALAVVGVFIWFILPLGKDLALVDLLSEQGYWETAPPADYYLPGTINSIEVRSDGRIAIHPTCKIDTELLDRVTLHSRTVDRTLAERLNKGFDISDRIEGILPFEIKAHKAKKLSLSLQNSSILQISDEELLLVRKEIIKDTCQEAIEWNLNNGATVCQTRAALKGDLVYRLIYEDGGSGHEGGNALPLDVETNQSNTDQIIGKGLIYGVSFAPRSISSKSADCLVGAKKKA